MDAIGNVSSSPLVGLLVPVRTVMKMFSLVVIYKRKLVIL